MENYVTIFICDLSEQALHSRWEAECIAEWEEHELELDIERDKELREPKVEQVEPEVFNAVDLMEWKLYGTDEAMRVVLWTEDLERDGLSTVQGERDFERAFVEVLFGAERR